MSRQTKLYKQKIIDMMFDNNHQEIAIDLPVFRQHLKRAKFTVNQSYSLLFEVLFPHRQYAAGRVLLLSSTTLFNKMLQEIKNCDAKQCMRLLLTLTDVIDATADIKMIDAVFDRLKALRALQKPAVEKTLVAIAQFAMLQLETIAPVVRIIKHLPNLDVMPLWSKKYFPSYTLYTTSSTHRFTLLITAVALEKKLITRYLLQQKAAVNFAMEDGRTPLIMSATKNNMPIYKMLVDRGANPALVDHNGYNALTYAVVYNAAPIVLDMEKRGHGFSPNWANKQGNSLLMLWLKKWGREINPRAAIAVFHFLLRQGGERALEWLNVRGESFLSLCQAKKSPPPQNLLRTINQGIYYIKSSYPERWLCLHNTVHLLTTISKKIQHVMKLKGLDALRSYSRIEAFRIIMALHLRFSEFFNRTFQVQAWQNIMQFYQKNSICLLINTLCCPPSDERDKNQHNHFLGLPTHTINHIDSYLPSSWFDKIRLDITVLYKKVTQHWEELIQGREVVVPLSRYQGKMHPPLVFNVGTHWLKPQPFFGSDESDNDTCTMSYKRIKAMPHYALTSPWNENSRSEKKGSSA